MADARDYDFMALPGMEADSNAHDTARHRSDDTAPASSKSALDALLDEYRAREERAREAHVVRLPHGHGHVGLAMGQRLREGFASPRACRLSAKNMLPMGPKLSIYQRSAILPQLN